jgi:hypothetical protein
MSGDSEAIDKARCHDIVARARALRAASSQLIADIQALRQRSIRLAVSRWPRGVGGGQGQRPARPNGPPLERGEPSV